MKRNITTIILGAIFAASAACGGSNGPTAPTAPTYANVAGHWTGNLQSANWASAAVDVTLSQTGANVDGTWASGAFDWNGQITGTTDATSFTGQITLSAPNKAGIGQRCTGTASIHASGIGSTTVTFTGAGFTGSCNGEPVNLTINLQRN